MPFFFLIKQNRSYPKADAFGASEDTRSEVSTEDSSLNGTRTAWLWRMRHGCSKRRYLLTNRDGVKSQRPATFSNTAVRNWNPATIIMHLKHKGGCFFHRYSKERASIFDSWGQIYKSRKCSKVNVIIYVHPASKQQQVRLKRPKRSNCPVLLSGFLYLSVVYVECASETERLSK